MESTEINRQLKYDEDINDLRLARDSGEKTPEVIDFCQAHFDAMVDAVKHSHTYKNHDFSEIVSQVKNDIDFLIIVSMFTDAYEEVLVWNKLIQEKKLDHNITRHHREMDISLYHKINDICNEKNYSIGVYILIWYWPRRNDPFPDKI